MTNADNGGEDPRFHKAVEQVLASYVSHGGINHIEGVNLPSRAVVVEILQDLQEVLFPGYFSKSSLESRNVRYVIGQRIARILSSLTSELVKALRHDHRIGGGKVSDWNEKNGQEKAHEIAMGLLEELPEIRRVLREDALAAFEGDPAAASVVDVILSYPSIRAIAAYRVSHFLHERGVSLIPRMMTEYEHAMTGIDIHPGATIGPGIFIDHGTGVVIGETTVIGKRVKIYQGVTLGALSVSRKRSVGEAMVKRHPTLEDETTIYAGATILGGQTVIGKGSVVGGNVWLTCSVPPGTKVIIDAPYLVVEKL